MSGATHPLPHTPSRSALAKLYCV